MSLTDRLINAIINEVAPDAVASLLDEFLSSKEPKGAYAFLIEHRNDDWYELLPKKAKRAIQKLAPTDLDWLNYRWLVQSVGNTNPAVASLLLSSPELKNIIVDRLETLKRRVYETEV